MELPAELDIVYEVEFVGGANYWIDEATFKMLKHDILSFEHSGDFGRALTTMSGSIVVALMSKISSIHQSNKAQREWSDSANKLYKQEENSRKDWDE